VHKHLSHKDESGRWKWLEELLHKGTFNLKIKTGKFD
jgi:hypothetical protein